MWGGGGRTGPPWAFRLTQHPTLFDLSAMLDGTLQFYVLFHEQPIAVSPAHC